MRRTREIVGLPVLNLQSGGQVGWVQDVAFVGNEVAGVVLEGGGLFHSDKGIPRSMIVAFGKDALTVSEEMVQEIKGTRWSQKIGNQVFTQGGDAQGTIQDVFLDDSVSRIAGYEVSDGLFADLVQGRGAILQQNVMVDGKDVLIVEDEVSPWDHGKEGGSLS
ncbi:MAG: PRC-barrel domain-containing protein [Desulfitobacterium hafniense]|nr:PRC-barrel domain-containing protein [Desulfitobacterium hafniense]